MVSFEIGVSRGGYPLKEKRFNPAKRFCLSGESTVAARLTVSRRVTPSVFFVSFLSFLKTVTLSLVYWESQALPIKQEVVQNTSYTTAAPLISYILTHFCAILESTGARWGYGGQIVFFFFFISHGRSQLQRD